MIISKKDRKLLTINQFKKKKIFFNFVYLNSEISLKIIGNVLYLVYFLNQKDIYLSAKKPYNLLIHNPLV